MNPKGNWLELAIISALLALLSVWGVIWDITSGLLASGIDGIMLLAVCLIMALIFAAMVVLQLQRGGILPSFALKPKTAPVAAPAAPAKQSPAPGAAPVKPAQPAPAPTPQPK